MREYGFSLIPITPYKGRIDDSFLIRENVGHWKPLTYFIQCSLHLFIIPYLLLSIINYLLLYIFCLANLAHLPYHYKSTRATQCNFSFVGSMNAKILEWLTIVKKIKWFPCFDIEVSLPDMTTYDDCWWSGQFFLNLASLLDYLTLKHTYR